MDTVPFEAGVAVQSADILDKCVACGACAEVCPMPAPAGITAVDQQRLAGRRHDRDVDPDCGRCGPFPRPSEM